MKFNDQINNSYYDSHNDSYNSGFIAVIAVVAIAFSALTFSIIVATNSYNNFDSVIRHESRIQRELDKQSCIDIIQIMMKKDYFLQGDIYLDEFHCNAKITKDPSGSVVINATMK